MVSNNTQTHNWDAQLVLRGTENLPHHYTTSLDNSYKTRWIHAFMLFRSNSDATIWMMPLKSRLLLSNFGEHVLWLTFSFILSGTSIIFYFCSPSSLRFYTLCIQRWLMLWCLSLIWNQSSHSPLTFHINKAFSPTQLSLTGYSLFLSEH